MEDKKKFIKKCVKCEKLSLSKWNNNKKVNNLIGIKTSQS